MEHTDTPSLESDMEYWRALSPLERYTLVYAAFHGLPQALALVRRIVDEIRPPLFPPSKSLIDEAYRIPWDQAQATYQLALTAIARNRPGAMSKLRRWLRQI